MEINGVSEQVPKTGITENIAGEGAALESDAVILEQGQMAPIPAAVDAGGSQTHLAQAPQGAQQKLAELLMSYGLKVTEENMALLEGLLSKQLPLNQGTIQKLNQFLKFIRLDGDTASPPMENGPGNVFPTAVPPSISQPAAPPPLHKDVPLAMEKALFFLENDIQPAKGNLQALDGLLHTRETILTQLINLTEGMDTLPPSPGKEELLQLFLGEEEAALHKAYSNALDTVASFDGKGQEKIITLLEKAFDAVQDQKEIPVIRPESGEAPAEETALAVTEKGVQAIKDFVNGHENPIQRNDILVLAKTLFPDSAEDQKAFLNQFPLPSQKPERTKQSILQRFTLDPGEANERDIDKTLNSLREALEKGEKLVEKSGLPKELGTQMKETMEHLDFYNQIKTCIYVPLPLNFGGRTTPGELYVFKDNKQAKVRPDHASALIALNTVNLGRIETYLQKRKDELTIQFRIDKGEAEPLLRANMEKLTAALKDHNYTVKNLSVTPLETPFHILEGEPEQPKNLRPEKILFDEKA